MESPIVTLTTDWGYHDFFAGIVKGKLYSYIPNVRVVDITHGIEPFQRGKAIFVVKNACMGFPKGTIHIIDIDASQTMEHPFVVVEHQEQYYICTDNGLPQAVFGDANGRAVLIDLYQETSFHTFAASNLFCKVAALLAQGTALAEIGPVVEQFTPYTPAIPTYDKTSLRLYVAYVDTYGNADLNITYERFEELRQGRRFEMFVREAVLKKVSYSYLDVPAGGRGRELILLTVSATGCLQVAMRESSAEQFLGLQPAESIIVKFYDK